MIKAARYLAPREQPSDEFPFHLVTGRTLCHFHTRTKTGRVSQLAGAAPQVWVEVSRADALDLGLTEGDPVRVTSPRGTLTAKTRATAIRAGVVFVPFHYGYWDTGDGTGDDHERAANELTVTDWDPASKQPLFKASAARVTRIGSADGPSAAPTTTASAPVGPGIRPTVGGPDAMVAQTVSVTTSFDAIDAIDAAGEQL